MESENSKCSPDIGLEDFRDFLSYWRGRSINDSIFNLENEPDERFLPFQESPPNRISSLDLHGFVLEWARQILHNLQCPTSFVDAIARIVIENYYNEYEMDLDQEIEGSEKLWRTVVSQLDSVLKDLTSGDIDGLLADERWTMLTDVSGKYSEYAIKNGRRTMEDVHVVIPDLNALLGSDLDPPTGYYAVFDGHAGNKAACYAATHLHHKVANIPSYGTNLKEAIRDGIRETDEGFVTHCNYRDQSCKSGCTAVCCFIRPTKLWLAWVGDSQAIVFGGGQPLTVTVPHKPEREDERERIEKLGGCVVHMGTWRVNGTLAVSRAIGDIENKPYVTADPDIIEVDLQGSEDFVLLACDGLWDVLNDEDVANIAYTYFGTFSFESEGPGLAPKLVTEAKKRGSSDNITVVVVYLKDYTTLHNTYLHLGMGSESALDSTDNTSSLFEISGEVQKQEPTGFLFNKVESQSFKMEQVTTSTSFSKSEFSQEWSTASNDQPFGAITTTTVSSFEVSSSKDDFDDFDARFGQPLLEQAKQITASDETDFTQYDTGAFYNRNVELENPLRDVYGVSSVTEDFSLGEVDVKFKKERLDEELVDEPPESTKSDSADIINWNEGSTVTSEQKQSSLLEFDTRQEISVSPKPYFESTLSPDAQPFVSRYYNQTQLDEEESESHVNEFKEAVDVKATIDVFSNKQDEPTEQDETYLNPFAADIRLRNESPDLLASCVKDNADILEEKAPFEVIHKVEVELEPETPSAPLQNQFSTEADTFEYQSRAVEHSSEDELEEKREPVHTPVQNVVFEADVMVPEVKLVYTENAFLDFEAETRNATKIEQEAIERQYVISPVVEDERLEVVSPAIEDERLEVVSPAVEDERLEVVSPAVDVELESQEVVSSDVDVAFERHEVVSPAFEVEVKQEIVSPEVEREGIVSPEVERVEIVSPEVERDEIVSPQVERQEVAVSDVEIEDVRPTAPLELAQDYDRCPESFDAISPVVEVASQEHICAAVEELHSPFEHETRAVFSPDVEVEKEDVDLVSDEIPEQQQQAEYHLETLQPELEIRSEQVVSPTFEIKREEAEIESHETDRVTAATFVDELQELISPEDEIREFVEEKTTEIVSPVVEEEPAASQIEPPVEEKRSILDAVSAVAADVEDDESEDGEGWKFYPTDANATTTNGEIKAEVEQVEIAVTNEPEAPVEIQNPEPVVDLNAAVDVAALVVQLPVTITTETTETKVEAVVQPSKPAPKTTKVAAKSKVSSTKSAKTETKSTATTVKQTTAKTSTSAASKEVKKPVTTAKLTSKPLAATSATAKTTKSAETTSKSSEVLKAKVTSSTTAKVTAAKKPVSGAKPAPVAPKTAVNGTTNGAAKESVIQTKTSAKTTEITPKLTTVKKSTPTATKPATVTNASPKEAPKKQIVSKVNAGTLVSKSAASSTNSSSGTATTVSKPDPKQAKEAMNKNLSGTRVTSTRTTTTTAAKTSTSSSTKVEASVTSKVISSTTTTTKAASVKTQLVNGSEKKEVLVAASKTKTSTSSTVGAVKSSHTVTSNKSPVAGPSTRLTPNKMTPPIAKSSPLKATSPTTPKSRGLTATPKTPTSVSKTNRVTHSTTPKSSHSPLSKKTKVGNVEKGTIDARSKEISNQVTVVKNGDCIAASADAGGGEPKIELELRNGFGKLDNGVDEVVEFHHTSANGSLIDAESLLQAEGDVFIA